MDLPEYLLGQMTQSVRSIESDVHDLKESAERMHGRLDRVRAGLEELTTWAQRLAVLAGMWGAAAGLNMAPEKLGELLAALLRSTPR